MMKRGIMLSESTSLTSIDPTCDNSTHHEEPTTASNKRNAVEAIVPEAEFVAVCQQNQIDQRIQLEVIVSSCDE